MTVTQDATIAELQRTIAELRQALAARTDEPGHRKAVIAMENARLLDELREALEQQTATAEVLQVINASLGDLPPIFDVIGKNAIRLCEAAFGGLMLFDGKSFKAAALENVPPAYAEFCPAYGQAGPELASGKIRAGADVVHIEDLMDAPAYRNGDPARRALVDLGGARTLLGVALRKDDTLLGAITIYRQEVRPFSDRQITLLQRFAAQAVIAMENARLINETREALAQQTATSEVLKAISASPDDAQPVFELIARRAKELSGAAAVGVFEYDGALMHHRMLEGYGAAAVEQLRRQFPRPPGRHSAAGRAVQSGQISHIRDTNADPDFAMPELEIVRSLLGVPLLHKGRVVGAIALARSETGGFDEAKVALVQSFAEQAVIAISSAETYHELQERTAALAQRNSEYGERIEQQSATIDVLKVMSASPGDAQPVFRLIVERARAFCEADSATLALLGGDMLHLQAYSGFFDREYEAVFPRPVSRATMFGRAILARNVVQAPDVSVDPDHYTRNITGGGARAIIAVPLLRAGSPIGAIAIGRRRRGEFSATQVELLKTFAEQAVIAIGSAETFGELQHRTADLTRSVAELQALEEVLRAVNSSLDLDTVLSTIISRATQLSQADEGTIYEYDKAKEVFVPKAAFGMSTERVAALRKRRIKLGETHLGRSAILRAPVYVEDVQRDPSGPNAGDVLPGIHAVLAVPLLRNDTVIGGLVIRRRTEEGFAETIVTLMQTFSGQAVLAIENARLFQEAGRARTAAEAALVDLRRAQDRLVQSEKMASLGQLTAGIAHEIKNPLNFVNNFSDLSVDLLNELQEAVAPEKLTVADGLRAEIDDITATLKGNLEKIAEHGRRADSIVKNMLLHSRTGPSEHRAIDVNTTVEEALNLAYHGARAETPGFNITMEKDLDPKAGSIDAFPQEFLRVMLNLISNGFYAARKRANAIEDKSFEPTLHVTTRNLGSQVEIRVRDNGTGIGDEVRDKIFEPFFTTKPAGEGTGLGLSLSYDIIVKQHGGQLTVDSRPSEFTEFQIILPRRMAANEGGGA